MSNECKILNKCDICGKFKKWEELDFIITTPESYYTTEDGYNICINCEKEDLKNEVM